MARSNSIRHDFPTVEQALSPISHLLVCHSCNFRDKHLRWIIAKFTGYHWVRRLITFLLWQLAQLLLVLWNLVLGEGIFVSDREFCIRSMWCFQQWELSFNFRDTSKGNSNSLYYFGSLLTSPNQQLERRFSMLGTGICIT